MRRHQASIAILIALITGCGSRSYLSAKSAKYPVSMSSAVRGPTGELLGPDELELKGKLSFDYLTCRMLWTLVPIKPLFGTEDISDAINESVRSKGGEAIVNLTVTSGATVWTVMTLVGVLPDCGKVQIRGDVVARKVTAPPAVPPAPAEPPAVPPTPATSPAPPTPTSSPAAHATLAPEVSGL